MKRRKSYAPEAHVRPADRYWEGAQEIVLRIALESPGLYAENARVRQNGHHPLTHSKYQHQLRQIRRREARKHETT